MLALPLKILWFLPDGLPLEICAEKAQSCLNSFATLKIPITSQMATFEKPKSVKLLKIPWREALFLFLSCPDLLLNYQRVCLLIVNFPDPYHNNPRRRASWKNETYVNLPRRHAPLNNFSQKSLIKDDILNWSDHRTCTLWHWIDQWWSYQIQ